MQGAEVQINVRRTLSITLSVWPVFRTEICLLVELVWHVAVGVAVMVLMQGGSLVHSAFRLQRDDHWEEPVRNE